MAKIDDLELVQFIHPGGEHSDDGNGLKHWNRKAHRRKFVETAGRRLDGTSTENLRFWAEWEAESCVKTIENQINEGPRFVHQPYYVLPASYTELQNTDPFVFGGFFYSICQQHTDGHATQMQRLARGSVILFGSKVGDGFALDTVFVVDGSIWHSASNFNSVLRDVVPPEYLDVALKPIYAGSSCAPSAGCTAQERFRLYTGATEQNPIEDMFSFFPCKPARECSGGFARPCIQLNGYITDNLTQGRKVTRCSSAGLIRSLWNDVRRQVLSQGLSIGVYANIPPAAGRTNVSRREFSERFWL
jgi:hypothetical protein